MSSANSKFMSYLEIYMLTGCIEKNAFAYSIITSLNAIRS